MPIAELEKLSVHYEWAGPQDGPVLILSHSLGSNLSMWEPQIAALAAEFRILRYDTRGHGRSSIPQGPYTLADLGNDVLALMDLLGIAQANFCGLSLGGITALWLGIHAPHRFHRLVASNTAARIGNAETWNARIQQVSEDGVAPIVEGTLSRWYTDSFRAINPAQVEATRRVLAHVSSHSYTACCAALRDADLSHAVKTITTPALIIAGVHDPVTTPADAQFLHQQIAASIYVELDAAHLSSQEDDEGFNKALRAFLRTTLHTTLRTI